MKTTLNKIRDRSPCQGGWEKLLKHLGKTKADDEELWLDIILDSNGLPDALWCLRAVDGRDKEMRLFAVWCARQVQHLMIDQRSLDALDVSERFSNGLATEQERAATGDAARAAARAATGDAARAAARAAAWAAAWDAARAAAWDAARAAAWAAAGDVAGDAAWDAAWDAAGAAAWAAAWDAAGDAQSAELRRIILEIKGE